MKFIAVYTDVTNIIILILCQILNIARKESYRLNQTLNRQIIIRIEHVAALNLMAVSQVIQLDTLDSKHFTTSIVFSSAQCRIYNNDKMRECIEALHVLLTPVVRELIRVISVYQLYNLT